MKIKIKFWEKKEGGEKQPLLSGSKENRIRKGSSPEEVRKVKEQIGAERERSGKTIRFFGEVKEQNSFLRLFCCGKKDEGPAEYTYESPRMDKS